MGTSSSKCKHPHHPPPQQGGYNHAPGNGAPGTFAAFQSPTMKFRAIADRFTTLDQVQEALRKGGLESSNLIVAVDFTKSNEWTGKRSFGGRSLHAIGDVPSPYEEAISVIGRTLSAFDDDGLIPCYGFGDATTGDRSVFSFLANDTPCQGLEQVVWRYRELCPYIRMAGPTSFAPAIRQAARIVERSGGQYHILLLVADGQVSRSSDLPAHQHSEQERDTINAIVEASHLPLSIIMVGVGDGPWDLMKDFDDALPERQFDNFQFVNFTDVMSQSGGDRQRRETLFALRALMEIPEQFQAIQRLGLMGAGHSSSASARSSRAARQARTNPPLDPPVPPAVAYGSAAAGPSGRSQPPAPAPPAKAAAASQPGSSKTSVAGCSSCAGGGAGGSSADAGRASTSGAGGSSGAATAAPAAATAADGPAPDPMFLCPITHDLMSDPVIATDGYSYERAAITHWLERHQTSPLTNARMPGGNTLIPNHALRSAIMEWKQRNGVE